MPRPLALTREVSDALADCELTHIARLPIDVAAARAQHAAYERALADAGYRIERLRAGADLPDSVFIEDTAVVFDEIAVITRPGAASRRGEVPAVAEALAKHRQIRTIEAPATIDGGDVLAAGRRVFVGLSSRTNPDAARQLRSILTPFQYSVCELALGDCLHLKSAVTWLGEDLLLANPEWVDVSAFGGFDIVAVDSSEPAAANALRLRDRVVLAAGFPRTADAVRARGLQVVTVDASELAKAEGGVTCCSLILEH